MNLNWFIDLPSALKGQSHSLHFDLKPGALAEGALNSMFVLVPLLVLFGLFRWRYHKIDELLEKLGNEVGQLKRDTQLHTPKAIGLTMLKGLPGTLLILAFGFWCYRSDISINNFYGRCRCSLRCFGCLSQQPIACLNREAYRKNTLIFLRCCVPTIAA